MELSAGRGPARLSAAVAGMAAQAVQVVVLREVLQVARGGEAVLGLALAMWLLGAALGAALWRRGLLGAALLVAVVPPATAAGVRLAPVTAGSWAPGAALLTAPAAFATGAFFAAVLRRADVRGAVAAEAVGAGAAGLALTLLLLGTVGAFVLLAGAAALCLAVTGRAGRAAAVFVVLLAAGTGPLERATLARHGARLWDGSAVAGSAETRYARLLWLRREGQHSLFANGQLVATVPDEVDAEAFTHLLLAAHPAPRRVLCLGGGFGGVLRECLRHPVERLELALLDGAVVDLVRDDLPPADREALARTEVRIGDPRRIAAEEPRDVVLVLAGEPLTLAANRTYTREFFAGVALRPGGIVAVALPAAAHEREAYVLARNVSVQRAMASLDVAVIPGTVDLLLGARDGAPDLAPELLASRLEERGIALRHHGPDLLFETCRPEEVERVTALYRDYPRPVAPAVPFAVEERAPPAPAPEVRVNTDLRPVAVAWSALVLRAREDAGALDVAGAGVLPGVLVAVALVGAAVVARRRSRPLAARLCAFTSGAASMALWVVLLMAHQARVGALYGDFAVLAAAFMAGFAAGTRLRARLWIVDLAFVGVALAVVPALPWTGRWLAAFASAAVGAAAGAALGNVAAEQPAAAPRLYALDLFGAATAALLFGGFFVPEAGAVAACLLAACLKVLSLLGQLATRP